MSSRATFAQLQGSTPTLYLDGQQIGDNSADDLDALEQLNDDDGARVQVEWDAIANGYVSPGWTCRTCGESFERWRDGQKHGRDEHGETPAELVQVAALVNSAAIDWTGDDITVTISTGDPRGAFGMTVRRLDDGTRILHVPHPTGGMLHEELTELHPGTYRIGGARSDWVDHAETLRAIAREAFKTDDDGYPLAGHARLARVQILLETAGFGKD